MASLMSLTGSGQRTKEVSVGEYEPNPETPSRLSRLTEAQLIEHLEHPITEEEVSAELQRRLDKRDETWRWIVGEDGAKVWVLPKDDETIFMLESQFAEVEATDLFGKSAAQWHAALTGEDLDTPGSRYGSKASQCAFWAVAALYVHREVGTDGEEPEFLADEMMSYAVNGNELLGELVRAYKYAIPPELIAELNMEGGDE